MPSRQSDLRWLAALALLLLIFGPSATWAQDVPPRLPTPRPDSAAVGLPDSLARPDTTAPRPPSASGAATSGLDKPVQFSARDSLSILFDETNGDRGRLVGSAAVTYGDVKLEAHAVDVLFDLEELRAQGLPSDTGLVGLPRFNQGSETFSGSAFAYNMGTERGRVVGARTQFEDGFIEANVAKVREDSTLYILGGSYTTCECDPGETPSYSMRSARMKVVDKKWIYTGPIQLYIFDVPTPFWLPFGFLPAQEGRRSGPLPPEYGEDQRGFYLRNWGYYWAVSDYMDLQVRAGLWSLGSWQVNPSFRYSLRDYYTGGISVDYVRERSGEGDDPDFTELNRVSLRWTHNQTLNPTDRLSANVNLSSSGYLRTVSDQYDDNVRQTITSSIQYTKRWPAGGRQLALNLRQNQLLATGAADLTLPDLTFTQSSRTPFKRAERGAGEKERWYEKVTVRYTGRLNNQYSFRPLPDDTLAARGADGISWYEALFDAEKHRLATDDDTPFEFKATHQVPVSATFAVNRLPVVNRPFLLNVSPRFDYNEDWFIRTERRSADTSNVVVTESVPGFFALRQFSTGVSTSTTVYGIFPVKVGPYQGVRHTLRPNLGFTYRPDFSAASWGYTRAYTDTSGTTTEYDIVRGVQRGLQQSLSFGMDNVFEAKRVRADSTGEQQATTAKLFNVNAGASYNFAADSLNLSDISVSGRTTLFNDKLSVNVTSSFSPYALNADGTNVVNQYFFSLRDFRLARLTRLGVSGGFSLRSSRGGGRRSALSPGTPAFSTAATSSLGATNPWLTSGFEQEPYEEGTDFAIPWSLDIRFNYNISKRFSTLTRTATINTNFDFNLTPRWKVRGQTGYDFERKDVVTTTVNILRDFDCWEMSFRWVPFGQFQSWGFDLHVKSGKLRDLLRIRQPRSEVDRGFGSALR